MNRLFVACELGETAGRVVLGTLQRDRLTLNEAARFDNMPAREKDGLLWNIAQLYQDVLAGLQRIGAYEEPVESVSCTAWGGDYLLFHADASFIPPTFHHEDARTAAGRASVLRRLNVEALYAESGIPASADGTLCQLAAESAKRLKRADHLLPIADGFNFLLSGAPAVEMSAASATQLFHPLRRAWSERLVAAAGLPSAKLLPAVVPAGTRLKVLRPELAAATRLDGTQIVAGCSHELAATLGGLPFEEGEAWGCLRLGANATLAVESSLPLIQPVGEPLNVRHLAGPEGALYCHAETFGLRVLDECRRFWGETDYMLDDGALGYLAASAEPLLSLVNFADARFAAPGELVAKIQSYCRDTGQPVPRKPGPVLRCLLESLACLYRRSFDELAALAGREIERVYLVSESSNNLLQHFIANALNKPVLVANPRAAAIGSLLIQAQATGHLKNSAAARHIVRQSFKTLTCHANPSPAWGPAYERFLGLCGAARPVEIVA